ncbi:hypothetical protein LG299_14205 [Microbacterium lacus]|uniref:hypothetical protein n=1 Tax=Microbacterium lacus TaxID=415217 RepID=UPI003851584E
MLENLTIVVLAGDPNPAPVIMWLQIVFTLLKWIAFIALALRTVFGDTLGAPLRESIQTLWAGIYGQRLGVILVVAVAAMTVFTGSGVQDQLPDVYRGWIRYPAVGTSGAFRIDLVQAGWATLVGLVVAVNLFLLGRQRGLRYYLGKPSAPPNLSAWTYVALGIALLALILTWMIDAVSFDPTTLVVFVAVLIVIPASSKVFQAVARSRTPEGAKVKFPDPFITTESEKRAGIVFDAGDFVVGAWIAVTFLGPFVALITPLTLNIVGAFATTRFALSASHFAGWAILLWVFAWVAPAVTWTLVRRYAPIPEKIKPSTLPEGQDPAPAEKSAPVAPDAAKHNTPDEPGDRAKDEDGHSAKEVLDAAKEMVHDATTAVKQSITSAFVTDAESYKTSSGGRTFSGAFALVGVIVLILFALFPFTAAKIGTVAVLQALLGAWAAVLGWLGFAPGDASARRGVSDVAVARHSGHHSRGRCAVVDHIDARLAHAARGRVHRAVGGRRDGTRPSVAHRCLCRVGRGGMRIDDRGRC